MVKGLPGYGPHEYTLVFNKSIQKCCLFLNKTFLLLLQVLFCFVVLIYHSLAVGEKSTTSGVNRLVEEILDI